MMKKLSECPSCQKRLTIIILGLAVVGVVLGTQKIIQTIKKY